MDLAFLKTSLGPDLPFILVEASLVAKKGERTHVMLRESRQTVKGIAILMFCGEKDFWREDREKYPGESKSIWKAEVLRW